MGRVNAALRPRNFSARICPIARFRAGVCRSGALPCFLWTKQRTLPYPPAWAAENHAAAREMTRIPVCHGRGGCDRTGLRGYGDGGPVVGSNALENGTALPAENTEGPLRA